MRLRIRGRAIRVGAGVLIVAAVVGGGVAAYADKANAPDDYRTAAVTYADVEQTLSLSGTITPSGRSDLSFTASGTVAKVKAEVGDKVTKGEVLARLDTTTLKAAVTKADAQLAAAKAQLAQDEDAQTTTVSSASTSASTSSNAGSSNAGSSNTGSSNTGSSNTGSSNTGSSNTGSSNTGSSNTGSSNTGSSNTGSSNPSGTGASTGSASSQSGTSSSASTAALTKALSQLTDEQRTVEADQTAVDTAIKAASADLDAETTACKASASEAASDASSTDAPSGSSSDAADTGSASTLPSTGPGSDACTNAVSTVQTDQASVAEKEKTLSTALTTLGNTLTNASQVAQSTAKSSTAGTSSSASDTSKGGASSGTTATGSKATASKSKASTSTASAPTTSTSTSGASSSAASSSASRSSSGATVTAATLAKDQASIDSARSTLVTASQALSGAVIKAPSAGTVAQVSVTAGGSATAGSDAIVLVAPGTTTIELSASSTQVAKLKVGQKAEVSPAGSAKTYTGRVTRIGQVPSTDTSGSSTYPVTITLDQQDLDLLTGAAAAVNVVVGSATHVLTVPTSAVSDGSVRVYDDGAISRARVTTSLVGQTRTVVTSGLKVGQEVVLADASTALPTTDSTTTNTRGGSFGGGSFGGASVGGPGGD